MVGRRSWVRGRRSKGERSSAMVGVFSAGKRKEKGETDRRRETRRWKMEVFVVEDDGGFSGPCNHDAALPSAELSVGLSC